MKLFKAPTMINLEITDVCNASCRHCYNYWRQDRTSGISMTKDKIDKLLDIFMDAKIFHVVLTGGEPFANFDVLEYGIRKCVGNNISVSCNSNLMLATDEKIKHLKDAGLDHILTSLNSYDPHTNDYLVHKEGAFNKIINGIKLTVNNGLRVSVNMIISKKNVGHIYNTGKLVHELGCQKIFGTRVVPSVNVEDVQNSEFTLNKEEALYGLEQLLKIKKDTGIMIGTLVSYPLCLLGDLEKFKDFVGRGCPGQSGHIMGINASGETHACVHQSLSYGNIFKEGIYAPYQRMKDWHAGNYRYKECLDCDYSEICKSGCRMSAHAYYGEMNEKDQLMENKENIIQPYKLVYDDGIYSKIEEGISFTVPSRLRFRKEEDFYLVNIRWANTISCPNSIAEFLMKYQKLNTPFTLKEIGHENLKWVAMLFYKDVIESQDLNMNDFRNKQGLGLDLMDLK